MALLYSWIPLITISLYQEIPSPLTQNAGSAWFLLILLSTLNVGIGMDGMSKPSVLL